MKKWSYLSLLEWAFFYPTTGQVPAKVHFIITDDLNSALKKKINI